MSEPATWTVRPLSAMHMQRSMARPGRPVRLGRRGVAGSAAAVASVLLVAGCAARPAPPAASGAEVEAARQSMASVPPPVARARSEEEDVAMLANVVWRLAAAAEPVCAAHLGRTCGFVVKLNHSATTTARAEAHGWNEVTVSAGMVRLAEAEDELAAVVGHEFGHHLAEHLDLRYIRGKVAGTAASALLGMVLPFGGFAGLLLSQGASQLGAIAARFTYAKEEEREADYLGAYLAARAGYDLERAGGIWAKLARPETRGWAGFLATHPAGAERLAAWRLAAEKFRAMRTLMPRRAGY